MMLLALILGFQDVPILSGRDATLRSMSEDLTAQVTECGTRAAFVVPPGKQLDDAKGVIEAAATPEQIACAKKRVSWLLTDAEAREKGFK